MVLLNTEVPRLNVCELSGLSGFGSVSDPDANNGNEGPAEKPAVLAGTVLFPILLPWLPTHEFSTKGFVLGLLVAAPFALAAYLGSSGDAWWLRLAGALAYLLAVPPVTAFLALNFTGSTTYTSRTGVRREIFAYVPHMAWMFGAGLALALVLGLLRLIGGF